jgi:hypothetical protein
MTLSLMFLRLDVPPLDGTAQRPPKRCSRVQIVSASHTGDKRMWLGKFMRIADARQIEIVMRRATFISTLRESHLPFHLMAWIKIEALDVFVRVDKQTHHRQRGERRLRPGAGSSSCIRPEERHKPACGCSDIPLDFPTRRRARDMRGLLQSYCEERKLPSFRSNSRFRLVINRDTPKGASTCRCRCSTAPTK